MEKFPQIVDLYTSEFRTHGDSPAAILSPKGRQHLRFRALDPLLGSGRVRILDYGCGLAHLFGHLQAAGKNVDYHGVDIVPAFIKANRAKYRDARFDVIEPNREVIGEYDVVFASGVFNMRSSTDESASRQYALERMAQLFKLAKDAFVCDFASSFVNYRQEEGQHFDCGDIARFCADQLTRRFVIRHDLLPYEFTLIAYRNSEITRPANVYTADAALEAPV